MPADNENQTTSDSQEATKSITVDFGSVAVELPAEQAKALIAERDKRQAEHRATIERLAEIDRQASEAAAKAKQAEDRAKAIELAKKGDLEAAERVWKDEAEKRQSALVSQMLNMQLDLALAKRNDLIEGTAPVVREYIAKRVKYDEQAGTAIAIAEDGSPAIDSDGKPMGLDGLLGRFLSDNPAFAKAQVPPPSGGKPAQAEYAGQVISRAAFDGMTGKQRAEFFARGGKLKD